jgi:hypothetical protein
LLFQVPTEREEKNSAAIASNDSFSSWTKTFTDPRLCAAIVDRLTFGGNIIETGTDSYRLVATKNQRRKEYAPGTRVRTFFRKQRGIEETRRPWNPCPD